MVHKKEEGTYHHIETLMKEMPGFLSPGRGLPLLLIPEYSGINKEQRIPDRSKTAHRKPPVKCFLTIPSILLYLLKKGLDQMSLVSINQPYRKATVNNKYNYQDNHQSYSSRPDTVGNTLKPSSWV